MDISIHDNYFKNRPNQIKNLQKFGSFNLKKQTKPIITKIFIEYYKIKNKND